MLMIFDKILEMTIAKWFYFLRIFKIGPEKYKIEIGKDYFEAKLLI